MTHPDYFEAVLQLRNPTVDSASFLAEKLSGKVSDVKEVKNGLDYYVVDKKVAQRVAKQLKQEFGGEFRHTSTLHTKDHQTSKELYRDTILVRLPLFEKGDVIRLDGKVIQVTGFGKKFSGDNLKTGKKEVLPYPDDFEKLEKHETRVVKVEPEVEVLHPETYQAVEPMNDVDKDFQVDEKVKVVVDKGVWLV